MVTPSPKSHAHDAGDPVDVSVNCTNWFVIGDVGVQLKLAAGAAVLAFAAILASAILTVETGFLISLAIFLVLAVSTFVALEIRRSSTGAVSPALEPGTPR